MNSIIYFVEFENRVISATYRNLMIGAKVVIVDKDQRGAIARSGHHDRIPGPQRLAADQASRGGQTGRLLPESVERAWRAGRAECRVSSQLSPHFDWVSGFIRRRCE